MIIKNLHKVRVDGTHINVPKQVWDDLVIDFKSFNGETNSEGIDTFNQYPKWLQEDIIAGYLRYSLIYERGEFVKSTNHLHITEECGCMVVKEISDKTLSIG